MFMSSSSPMLRSEKLALSAVIEIPAVAPVSFTSRSVVGVPVPIPTFPLWSIVTLSSRVVVVLSTVLNTSLEPLALPLHVSVAIPDILAPFTKAEPFEPVQFILPR